MAGLPTTITNIRPTLTGSSQNGYSLTIPTMYFTSRTGLNPITYRLTTTPLTVTVKPQAGSYTVTLSGVIYGLQLSQFPQIIPAVTISTSVSQGPVDYVGSVATLLENGDAFGIAAGVITTDGVNLIIQYPSITYIHQAKTMEVVNYGRVALYLPVL